MNVQLISNGTSLDLRDSESIKIVDSIQDARDLNKITSAYSRQFNLPATAKNNIFFEHYFNFGVLNGFDARFKVDATINISGFRFKKGKLRLNSVSIENGEPRSYKVVFFGESIEFKDLIGDDLLSGLDLTAYDHPFDDETVQSGLIFGLGQGGGALNTFPNIVYPLMSHTRRFVYNNAEKFHAENETGIDSKLKKEDLKPGISIATIIDAIEAKYGLTFSSDFLEGEVMKSLYLWLNRNEGEIKYDQDNALAATVYTPIEDLVFSTGVDVRPLIISPYDYYKIDYTINTADTNPYTFRIINENNGDVLAEAYKPNGGNATISCQIDPDYDGTANLAFVIDTTNILTITQTVTIEAYAYDGPQYGFVLDGTGDYNFPSNTSSQGIIISRVMPEIKVFDLLTMLFKMFNLTAYKNDQGLIVVEPLPDFYDNPTVYDITQYVDWSRSEIDRLFPYSSIDFKFAGRDTFLLKNRDEATGLRFGNLDYNGNEDFDGSPFEIKVDAEKILYERLNNIDTGAQTSIAWGWPVSTKQESIVTKPILFFRRQRAVGSDTLEFNVNGSATPIANYNQPSNTLSSSETINFGPEIDEYSLTTNSNGLFQNYYRDFVASLYDSRARMVRLDAYLPLNIVLNYSLRDVFIIQGKRFRINKISTDVITGKSELQLFVDVQKVSLNLAGANPGAVSVNDAQLSIGSVTQTTIEVNYNGAIAGVTGISTYQDNRQLASGRPYSTKNAFTNLLSGVYYRFGIQFEFANYNSEIFWIYEAPNLPAPPSGTWDDDIADFSNDYDTFDIE